MESTKITIRAVISADKHKTWNYYTQPEHITKWNFATENWHCPSANNDMRVGGKYIARMEAKDGSFGFDFEGIYNSIEPLKKIEYTLSDGRKVFISFVGDQKSTTIFESFEAENENSLELQEQGWQAILNHFKLYTETH